MTRAASPSPGFCRGKSVLFPGYTGFAVRSYEAGGPVLISKSRAVFGVRLRPSLRDAVKRSTGWSRRHLDGATAAHLGSDDIAAFEAAGRG